MTSELTKRVLVLGDDARSCLTVVRSMGRKGIEVVLGIQDYKSIVPKSRYVSKVVQLPSTTENPDQWFDAVISTIRTQPVDLVIPTADESLVPLVTRRNEIENITRCALPNQSGFEQTYYKHLTFELAERLQVPIPLTLIIHPGDDVNKVLGRTNWVFPLVVKPSSSKVWKAGRRIELAVKVARDCTTLERYVCDLLPLTPVLIQQFVFGVGVGQEFLCKEGQILAAFQHERVHEPPSGGGSSYRRSVPLDMAMLQASTRLLEGLQWTGVAMIEYKQDAVSGQFALMEINGRFWGSLALAVSAGVDFPYHLYQLLVLGEVPPDRTYRKGLYVRNLLRDFEWFAQNISTAKDDPLLRRISVKQTLCELVNIPLGRERLDTLVIDDPVPGLVELGTTAKGILKRAARFAIRVAWQKVVVCNPVRIRNRNRICKLAATKPTLLLVCKGNICRSPFAEFHLRSLLSDKGVSGILITSAGNYPQSGRTPPELAQQVALEFGVDLSSHRSRVLSSELVETAGSIICMDQENLSYIKRTFPQALSRLFLLGPLSNEMPVAYIDDPWGGSLEQYRACFQKIVSSNHNLVEALSKAV